MCGGGICGVSLYFFNFVVHQNCSQKSSLFLKSIRYDTNAGCHNTFFYLLQIFSILLLL